MASSKFYGRLGNDTSIYLLKRFFKYVPVSPFENLFLVARTYEDRQRHTIVSFKSHHMYHVSFNLGLSGYPS